MSYLTVREDLRGHIHADEVEGLALEHEVKHADQTMTYLAFVDR